MNKYAAPFLLPCLLISLTTADVLDDIKPGEWYVAPNSKLSSVQPVPLPSGFTGILSVMAAWSGGAYDTKRDRLIIWGGGHTDYSGNEVYAFDIASLKWIRLNAPSKDVGGSESSGIYPDNAPRARHTYNYITYVPTIDRFCSAGGTGMYPSGQTNDEITRCFDFEKLAWEAKSIAPTANIGTLAAYDPVTKKVWSLAGGQSGLFASWDGAADKWNKFNENGWTDYSYTPAIGQGRMVLCGGGKVSLLDILQPDAPIKEMNTTGPDIMVKEYSPGFVYDSKANLFVGWDGGKDLYALDLGKASWTKVALATTNLVTPTAGQKNGTFGRFQYIPSRDLFIGVNGVEDNVYFFRLPADLKGSSMGIRSRSLEKARSGMLKGTPFQYQGGRMKLDLAGSRSLSIYSFNQRLVRHYDLAPQSGNFEFNPGLARGAYLIVKSGH
jgi:hypothetical protein